MDKGIMIGSGTYGKVYKSNIDGRNVAVKFIEDDEDGMRELGEVNLLKKFEHPNILKRFENLFVLPSEIGITLPLATSDLFNAVEGGISEETKDQWVYELLSGVHFIHKNGYYHCDIKPQNFLIISGRAVIADLGLMGLNMLEANRCQTICNPQLLYQRLKPRRGEGEMQNPIYKKRFKNSQTDLWALGETVYYIEHAQFPIYNTVSKMNKYIETNKLDKTGRFNRIIKTLMNPDPEQLDINMVIFLGEEPFSGKYANYISGTFNNNIPNDYPVIFTESLKPRFSELFEWIFGIMLKLQGEWTRDIVAYNTIDMWYRIFNRIKDVDEKILLYACLTLSGKIYSEGVDYANYIYRKALDISLVIKTERKIIEVLGGVLDRDLPIFYGSSLEKFKKWIVENPEKYEQFNMPGLVSQINS